MTQYIFFGFLCLWAMVSIRRLVQVPFPNPSPYQVFTRFFLFFTNKCFINLILLWSGFDFAVLFKCVVTVFFYSSAIMKLQIESCRCFFRFPRKLSLSLMLASSIILSYFIIRECKYLDIANLRPAKQCKQSAMWQKLIKFFSSKFRPCGKLLEG